MNVFVNGRRVAADIIDLNVEEGWVDIEDPTVLKDVLDMSFKPEVDVYLPTSGAKLPTKRLYGKVVIKTSPEF